MLVKELSCGLVDKLFHTYSSNDTPGIGDDDDDDDEAKRGLPFHCGKIAMSKQCVIPEPEPGISLGCVKTAKL